MLQVKWMMPALLALAGCIDDESGDAVAQPGCGAANLGDLVGQPYEADLLPAEAKAVRVLRPGDLATMDHRPDRLNVVLDDDNRIAELRCG